MKRWIFFIVCLILIAKPILASEKKDSSLEVSPAYVDISLEKPDQVEKLELEYTNHSAKTVSLQIFPIDFKQANDFGAVELISQSGSYSYSLSSFLSLESTTIVLEPGQKKTFVVTIKNREDLSPGGHYAAIVAKLQHEGTTTYQTEVSPAVSSLILLRKVGGERFNLSLKDINWPENFVTFGYSSVINLTFQNEGNIHMIPYGRVDITDMFGRLIYKGIINTSSVAVFPESLRHIYVDLQKVERGFPISLNTLTITGQDSLKKSTYHTKEMFLYVSPILLMSLTILVIGVIVFLRKK